MKRKNIKTYYNDSEEDYRKVSLNKVKEDKERKLARNFRNALKSKNINALLNYDNR